jgi:hypothetical protein
VDVDAANTNIRATGRDFWTVKNDCTWRLPSFTSWAFDPGCELDKTVGLRYIGVRL